MKNTLRLSLRANEKLYINGAVIKVDRKASIELLNDVQFLLEQHVLQLQDANTPLKQLYFIVQVMLMNPAGAEQARGVFKASLQMLLTNFKNASVLSALKQIDQLVAENQVYEALKAIRGLYGIEEAILNPQPVASRQQLPLAMAGA